MNLSRCIGLRMRFVPAIVFKSSPACITEEDLRGYCGTLEYSRGHKGHGSRLTKLVFDKAELALPEVC
jgi:hypothetical protein